MPASSLQSYGAWIRQEIVEGLTTARPSSEIVTLTSLCAVCHCARGVLTDLDPNPNIQSAGRAARRDEIADLYDFDARA